MAEGFGFSISNPGSDVESNNPADILFSSDFESLKMYKQYHFTVTFRDFNVDYNYYDGRYEKIFDLDLGYAPITRIWRVLGNGSLAPLDAIEKQKLLIGADGVYQGGIHPPYWYWDADPRTRTYVLQVYRNPLDATFDTGKRYNLPRSADRVSADVGLAISKVGKDVNSKNPADFLFNTRYKVMAINNQQCGSGTTDTPIEINHGLGYIPVFYLFRKNTYYSWPLDGAVAKDLWTFQWRHDSFEAAVWADETNIYIGPSAGENINYSCIIFKDPV